ncbi:MAG: aminotransferase [Prevotella sp.]|jgi:hypothetical protein
MKKRYEKPKTEVLQYEFGLALLSISAGTQDPTEGGDPTEGMDYEVSPWEDVNIDIPW